MKYINNFIALKMQLKDIITYEFIRRLLLFLSHNTEMLLKIHLNVQDHVPFTFSLNNLRRNFLVPYKNLYSQFVRCNLTQRKFKTEINSLFHTF